jgi:hypothetical protein
MCVLGSANVFWASMRAWRFVPAKKSQHYKQDYRGAEIPEPEIRITSLRVDVSIPKFFSYPKCALNRPIRKADVHFPFLSSRYHSFFVLRS